MAWLRIGLPAIVVAGVILIIIGGDAPLGAGIVLIGVAGLVALANVLIRLSIQSERDRERERSAGTDLRVDLLDDLELHQRGTVGDGAAAVLRGLGVPARERRAVDPGAEMLLGLPARVDEVAALALAGRSSS